MGSNATGVTAQGKTVEADAQTGWRTTLRAGHEKPSLLVFVRAATQRARAVEVLLGTDQDRKAWQVAAGITLSAF